MKKLHIHLIPRYSHAKEFNGYTFTDEGWGHPMRFRPAEELPDKSVVFAIVKELRWRLSRKDIKEFKVEIFTN